MIVTRERSEIENGVVQLRFADANDDVQDINARDLIEVLEGLQEFSAEMWKSGEFGDGAQPEIRVRVPKQGSFVLEALVWLQENPITGAGLGLVGIAGGAAAKEMGKEIGTAAGKAMVTAIGVGLRKLRDEKPVDAELLGDGEVLLTWPDETTTQITREAWEKLNAMKRQTRRSLRKILAPLGKNADRLELRDASVAKSTSEILDTPPEAVAGPADFIEASTDPETPVAKERVFETEAVLRSIDFESPEKWRVETTKNGTRQAKIEDSTFLESVNKGEALHKNDIFWLKIREDITKEPGKNARTDWTVLTVERRKRGERDVER